MKIILIIYVMLLFLPFSHLDAQPVDAKKDPKIDRDRQKPIKIDADRLEANNAKRMVTFIGNVHAVQEDTTIRSDRLILYFRKEGQPGTPTTKEPMQGGEVERIEARGRVTIHMQERTATGDEALFYQDSRQIILTGNATLREGPNLIKGDKVTVFLDEDRGIVEGSEKVRVSATIYTGDRSERKK